MARHRTNALSYQSGKSHKIEILAKTYLGISIDESAQEKKSQAPMTLFDEIPEEDTSASRRQEAAATCLLGEKIWEEMGELGLRKLYDDMEEPLGKVLSKMEREGVKIDLVQLRRYSSGLATEMNAIQEKVREMAGEPELNILSPKQIGALLFESSSLTLRSSPRPVSDMSILQTKTLSARLSTSIR